jgi:hypothetical protein
MSQTSFACNESLFTFPPTSCHECMLCILNSICCSDNFILVPACFFLCLLHTSIVRQSLMLMPQQTTHLFAVTLILTALLRQKCCGVWIFRKAATTAKHMLSENLARRNISSIYLILDRLTRSITCRKTMRNDR